jgi:hypothetical protein
MKIRNGFVSNSSSSSFVAVGVKLNRDLLTEELRELADDFNYEVFADSECGYDDPNFFVIGEYLACGDDEEFDDVEYDVEDITRKANFIMNNMGIEDYGKPVVISGTRLT